MKILVAGGTGFVGRHLVHELLKRHDTVTILGRNKNKINKIYENKVAAITWQEIHIENLCNYEIIINLAGENLSEKRWTEKVKKEILESRCNTTEVLANLCATLGEKSPRLFNASAVGIYGTTGDYADQPIPVDESWQPPHHTANFLSHVAQQWEKALTPAIAHHVSVTIMRFGVVLKENEGMLKKLLPSVKWGFAAKLGNGQQWLSWISIDDLVAAIIFLIEHPEIFGEINLTHPLPVTQNEFIHTLAQCYHKPCFLTLPTWLVKILFGQMGKELLLSGQNVIPTRLLNSGFKFVKKNISDAFK